MNSDGSLRLSSGVLSATKPPATTGYYYVDFKKDVSGCAWTATLSNFNAIGVTAEITTYAYPFESGERVRVATRESGGAAANKPFVMSVFC